MGRFLISLSAGNTLYIPDKNEIYPRVYPTDTLNAEQVERIKTHVKSLRK